MCPRSNHTNSLSTRANVRRAIANIFQSDEMRIGSTSPRANVRHGSAKIDPKKADIVQNVRPGHPGPSTGQNAGSTQYLPVFDDIGRGRTKSKVGRTFRPFSALRLNYHRNPLNPAPTPVVTAQRIPFDPI